MAFFRTFPVHPLLYHEASCRLLTVGDDGSLDKVQCFAYQQQLRRHTLMSAGSWPYPHGTSIRTVGINYIPETDIGIDIANEHADAHVHARTRNQHTHIHPRKRASARHRFLQRKAPAHGYNGHEIFTKTPTRMPTLAHAQADTQSTI